MGKAIKLFEQTKDETTVIENFSMKNDIAREVALWLKTVLAW